jgi:hypothetical protein
LDIEFNDVAMSGEEALLMIPLHFSHTRRLCFQSLSKYHFHSIREIYSREAPALEYFELTTTGDSLITFSDLGGNMLFKGGAPRLRTFSLDRVVIPWSLIPRGQLTQFNEDVDSLGDLNQLIDLLANRPVLEILALDFCLPSQLTEFPHGRMIDPPSSPFPLAPLRFNLPHH